MRRRGNPESFIWIDSVACQVHCTTLGAYAQWIDLHVQAPRSTLQLQLQSFSPLVSKTSSHRIRSALPRLPHRSLDHPDIPTWQRTYFLDRMISFLLTLSERERTEVTTIETSEMCARVQIFSRILLKKRDFNCDCLDTSSSTNPQKPTVDWSTGGSTRIQPWQR